jgi:hypothetical protein
MTSFDHRPGAPARPHQLSNPTYDPEQVKVLGEAFDAAWEYIAAGIGDEPRSIEAARLRLADIILRLAGSRALNAQELKRAALKRIFAEPLKP